MIIREAVSCLRRESRYRKYWGNDSKMELQELVAFILLIFVRLAFLAIFKLFSKRNLIRCLGVTAIYIIFFVYEMYSSSDEYGGIGAAVVFLWIWILLIILEIIFCKNLYLDKEGNIDTGRNRWYAFTANIVYVILFFGVSGVPWQYLIYSVFGLF